MPLFDAYLAVDWSVDEFRAVERIFAGLQSAWKLAGAGASGARAARPPALP